MTAGEGFNVKETLNALIDMPWLHIGAAKRAGIPVDGLEVEFEKLRSACFALLMAGEMCSRPEQEDNVQMLVKTAGTLTVNIIQAALMLGAQWAVSNDLDMDALAELEVPGP